MIQLELQFLETEIQTARDYGLNATDQRSDGLEELKDALELGANKLGLGEALKKGKEEYGEFKNAISQGARQAARRREN